MIRRGTEHLSRIHVEAQQSELFDAQNLSQSNELAISDQGNSGFGLSKDAEVLIPPEWKVMLPDNKVATVLPFKQASVFRDLCRQASLVLRPDGSADILGILRGDGVNPVAITGIFDRNGKQASGFLTFSGKSSETKEVSEIAFTILYGHPDSSWMHWEGLFDELEKGFMEVGGDSARRKRMISSWEPHLAPLSDAMNSLERSAFAVVFSGKDHDMGRLEDLGVRKFPVITSAYRHLMNKLWRSVPRVVGAGGGFVPIGV